MRYCGGGLGVVWVGVYGGWGAFVPTVGWHPRAASCADVVSNNTTHVTAHTSPFRGTPSRTAVHLEDPFAAGCGAKVTQEPPGFMSWFPMRIAGHAAVPHRHPGLLLNTQHHFWGGGAWCACSL